MNVLVDGAAQIQSPYPSFMTFPVATHPQPFQFIVLSDFSTRRGQYEVVPTFSNAALEGAAFVFIGGDFDHSGAFMRATLGTKRKMFKNLYDPNTVGLFDFVNSILWKMPMAHQWDDWDGAANDADKTSLWGNAYTAFREYVPAYELPATTPGTWQNFSYAHVDFFVLDNRSQRDPKGDLDDASKSMLDGNILGPSGQLEWLKQGLVSSVARWKIIFTSVVANPTAKGKDSWMGYQTEWQTLSSFIEANQITGIILISGDLHMGAIDNGAASGFPEMCVPTADGVSPNVTKCATGPEGSWSEGKYNSPGPCRGYSVVRVLTDPDHRVVLEVKDKDGGIRVSYTVL